VLGHCCVNLLRQQLQLAVSCVQINLRRILGDADVA
jgi:hypothetical protein